MYLTQQIVLVLFVEIVDISDPTTGESKCVCGVQGIIIRKITYLVQTNVMSKPGKKQPKLSASIERYFYSGEG